MCASDVGYCQAGQGNRPGTIAKFFPTPLSPVGRLSDRQASTTQERRTNAGSVIPLVRTRATQLVVAPVFCVKVLPPQVVHGGKKSKYYWTKKPLHFSTAF